MTRNLAHTRHGIPRGGLKRPAELVPNSPDAFDTRPATRRGRVDASPSERADGIG